MATNEAITTATVKRRCRPGDLAWLTGSVFKEALGRVVLIKHIEREDEDHQGQWVVEIQGAMIYKRSERRYLRGGWVSDENLIPFGGQKPLRPRRRSTSKGVHSTAPSACKLVEVTHG
ncbi:MAG TPA: hypothetical protein VFR90_01410 [Methylibium sp.]|uniref:hypothetical protein n=1 Tax=Methylibium sp. TaxID=2067992 RepID=UPI002DBB0D9B|nr:hypothetical protein [Methylibium sp.]HEU4457763.1 hypothetical protein [Methylibium sp.]